MKFVCVGRNYAEHARELGNEIPDAPLLFMKPSTAAAEGHRLQLPGFSQSVHYEAELVLRIDRRLRDATAHEADAAWREVTVGLDLTARDLQDRLKAKGQPWELAKAFDGSAVLGAFHDRSAVCAAEGHFLFELHRNGAVVQRGDTRQMIHGINELLAYISRHFTLEPGDMVFTGTPAGVGPLSSGDTLEAYLGGRQVWSGTVA
jgi:2-keto-4-pentenoate hydratase/2-oxohepta-3-ene-1,7-dioic acid hydratase in catechol pathway